MTAEGAPSEVAASQAGAAALAGPLTRLRGLLEDPSAARRLPLFLWIFAAYLAIRGVAYQDLRLLIPCALLLPFDATRRWAALAALVVEAALLRKYLPLVANHGLLELWILVLLALVDARAGRLSGRAATARALMGALLLLVLWSGVQKVLHGYYPAGEYFTAELAQPGKFAERLSWLLPADEQGALASYRTGLWAWSQTAAADALSEVAPRPRTLVLLSQIACWSTLAAELGLPVLLAWRRTRAVAAGLLALFFTGVEAAADEWHFALLVLALLLFFVPERFLSRLLVREGASTGDAHDAPPLSRPAFAAIMALVSVLALWPACQFALTRSAGLYPWKLGGFAMYAVPGRWDVSRIDVRTAKEGAWKVLSKKEGGAPKALLEAEEDALKNAPFDPFADAAVRRIGLLVHAFRPDVTAVRVRSRVVAHDLASGRFRLVERVYVSP